MSILYFTGSGATTITSFDAARCFMPGTHIATPDGDTPVETLTPGDRVVNADGRETDALWIGRQEMSTELQHPAKINPICVTAGALGPGRPARLRSRCAGQRGSTRWQIR